MGYDPKKDVEIEKMPGSQTAILRMRCLPCGEVVYEREPGDSPATLRGRFQALAFHMSVRHDATIRPDGLLDVRRHE